MRIRPAAPADAPALAAIYAPFVTETWYTFELEAPSAAEMRRRIEDAPLPWFVAEDDGRIAGYAYATPHRRRAAYRFACETSIYVGGGARRRGIGRRLYRVLLERLAALGLRRALAGIALPNPPSVAFHEALGFRRVALYPRIGWKLGSWRDVSWWLRDLGPDPDAPPSCARSPASR